MSKDYTYKLEKDKQGNTTLSVTVNSERLVREREKVFTSLAPKVKITGFRPGKAPKAMIESHLGSELYERTVNRILPLVAAEIVSEEKLEPLTQLEYSVSKLSDTDGVEFTAKFINFPEVKIADLSKIKPGKIELDVKQEEIDAEEKRILEMYNNQQKKATTGEKEPAKKDDAKSLTDEIVTELKIEGIKTLEELRGRIKENLTTNKKLEGEEKQIREILDEAVKLSSISAPEGLIEEELHRRRVDYTSRIEQVGLKVDDFLKSQNTTLEKLSEEWKPEAITRINTEILLAQIVRENGITADDAAIDAEINSISDEKLRAEYSTSSGRRYIANVMLQQKAIAHVRKAVGLDK